MDKSKKTRVENLIDHLLSHGYLTLSRKYSKYLPSPKPIHGYDIDVIAENGETTLFNPKAVKKIAIGIVVSEDEINNQTFLSKLVNILRSQNQTRKKFTLFVGVPSSQILKVDMLIETLEDEIKSKIKLVPL